MFVYNDANATDRDPKRPLPQEDANGRMHIEEPQSASIDKGVISGVCMVAAGIGCLYVGLYLIACVTPYMDQFRYFTMAICLVYLFAPLTLILIFAMLFPAQLDISEEGITYVSCGKTRKIGWGDVMEIHLCTLIDAESDTLTRYVKLIDFRHNSIRLPACHVSPKALAEYLVSRKNKESMAPTIILHELGWLETLRAGHDQQFRRSFVVFRFMPLLAYLVAGGWLCRWMLYSWGLVGG